MGYRQTMQYHGPDAEAARKWLASLSEDDMRELITLEVLFQTAEMPDDIQMGLMLREWLYEHGARNIWWTGLHLSDHQPAKG